MATVNKRELASYLASVLNIKKSVAEAAIDDLFTRIVAEVNDGNEVNIAGFGKFKLKVRAPRSGRNPRTGEVVKIGEKRRIAFRASIAARAELAGTPEQEAA